MWWYLLPVLDINTKHRVHVKCSLDESVESEQTVGQGVKKCMLKLSALWTCWVTITSTGMTLWRRMFLRRKWSSVA